MITTVLSFPCFFAFPASKENFQRLWLTLILHFLFFFSQHILLAGFSLKWFFVARFCFSLLLMLFLILDLWTSEAFTQCTTNTEIFRSEIFWLFLFVTDYLFFVIIFPLSLFQYYVDKQNKINTLMNLLPLRSLEQDSNFEETSLAEDLSKNSLLQYPVSQLRL